MSLHLAIYVRDNQGLVTYKGVESNWPDLDTFLQSVYGRYADWQPQEFGVLMGWPDSTVLWIGDTGVAVADKPKSWGFKGYTIGLECRVPGNAGEQLRLVKVEIEENALGCLRLTPVSGRNLGAMHGLGKALITPAQRDAAPHKQEETAYAVWALAALGLEPARLASEA